MGTTATAPGLILYERNLSVPLYILILLVKSTCGFSVASLPSNRPSLHVLCSTKVTAAVSVTRTVAFEEGQHIMDTLLLPETERGIRMNVGRDAQGLEQSTPVSPTDPRMQLTYGEFPLRSMDELIDLALPHVTCSGDGRIEMVDLGSGCGRLALYASLTRGTPKRPWSISGIEISSMLHNVAVESVTKGVHENLFDDSDTSCGTSLLFHTGPAAEFKELFDKVNLIFCYSTAWEARGFNEEWGAMILGSEWSLMLAQACRPGCVVITTDRALDPKDGWVLVDRLDVENREVMGSTGFIQVLQP